MPPKSADLQHLRLERSVAPDDLHEYRRPTVITKEVIIVVEQGGLCSIPVEVQQICIVLYLCERIA